MSIFRKNYYLINLNTVPHYNYFSLIKTNQIERDGFHYCLDCSVSV